LVDAFGVKKIWEHIRSLWRRLLELRDTPHAVAGGVAIGVFYGFTPLFMLKTLLSVATAWFARCSKIAAVLAVCLHDVIAPLWPLLLRIEYDIGFWILSNPHRLPPKLVLQEVKLNSLLHWASVVNLVKWLGSYHGGLPVLVGSLVIAIPAALIAYFVTYGIVRKRTLSQLGPGG
jgi:uncharacterized protein (DUF2062 family)